MSDNLADEMSLTDEEIDADEVGITIKPANVVTEDDINKAVKDIFYHQFPETTLTVCCIVLHNGFTIVGQSATVDPTKFSKLTGEHFAYEDAKRQIGRFLGYNILERKLQGL